jgi:hypothetical protein
MAPAFVIMARTGLVEVEWANLQVKCPCLRLARLRRRCVHCFPVTCKR